MWPVSPMWELACRGSHVVELRVDAYRNGVLVASNLPVDPESATLKVDGTALVRRSVDLTISDPSLVPITTSSLLDPHAVELRIFRGFRYPDGTSETIPVGRFRIATVSTALYGGIVISGVDAAKLVADDAYVTYTDTSTIDPDPNPTSSAGGATYLSEMQRWLTNTLPDASISVSDAITTDEPLPITTWEEGTSKLAAINELAVAIDVEVYCDNQGTFVIAPMPDPDAAPVWTIDLGEDGVIVAATEDWDRDTVFNAVTVRGERADGTPPVYWTAKDNNPHSPTYWNGPFGRRPKVYTSAMIRSYAQALRAAATMLQRAIAPVRSMTVSMLPNPALEPGDMVLVRLPPSNDRQSYREVAHMIRGYTLPLGLGAMEVDLFTPERQV
jgi:Domain of unknown function (DUF5047)